MVHLGNFLIIITTYVTGFIGFMLLFVKPFKCYEILSFLEKVSECYDWLDAS